MVILESLKRLEIVVVLHVEGRDLSGPVLHHEFCPHLLRVEQFPDFDLNPVRSLDPRIAD